MVQRAKSSRIDRKEKEGRIRFCKVFESEMMSKEELDEIFDAKHRFACICREGNLERVKIIYNWVKDDSNKLFNAFCAACLTGQLDIINFFFEEKEFKLTNYDNKDYALIYASHSGNIELVKLLMSKEDFSREAMESSLDYSLMYNSFSIVDYFLNLNVETILNNNYRASEISNIYEAREEKDLIEYLLDKDEKIRSYAEYKLKKIEGEYLCQL